MVSGIPISAIIGPVKRLYLKRLPKIWLAFIFANICPTTHVSDVFALRPRILWSILRKDSVNVAAVMSDAIADSMSKHAISMVFPSLIPNLCITMEAYQVQAQEHEVRLKMFDRSYIMAHCKESPLKDVRSALKIAGPTTVDCGNADEPLVDPTFTDRQLLEAIMYRIHVNDIEHREEQEHQRQQNYACYNAITDLYKTIHSVHNHHPGFVGVSPELFMSQHGWPEDRHYQDEGAGAPGAGSSGLGAEEEASSDEEE